MKTAGTILIVATSMLAAFVGHAQTFSIDWSKIAGGGGTSTGGVYAVSGTIGQPDAGGPHTNGVYSLTGGFWALPFAVQTPDAPLLTIVPFGPGQARTVFYLGDHIRQNVIGAVAPASGASPFVVVTINYPQ